MRFKVLAEQLEFFLRRHALEIDDGDLRRPLRFAAEKLFITIDQHFQHQAPPLESANVVPLGETLHDRKLFKYLVGCVRVCDPSGAFAVQFDETVGPVR